MKSNRSSFTNWTVARLGALALLSGLAVTSTGTGAETAPAAKLLTPRAKGAHSEPVSPLLPSVEIPTPLPAPNPVTPELDLNPLPLTIQDVSVVPASKKEVVELPSVPVPEPVQNPIAVVVPPLEEKVPVVSIPKSPMPTRANS